MMPSQHPGFEARGITYLNGHFVPLEDAKISIATHAFNYGTGCFEGIRAYWNESHGELYALRVEDHFRRLARSAKLLRIELPASPGELTEMVIQLLRWNHYREDAYIRPVAYKASPVIRVGLIGIEDGFACFTAPMGAYHDLEAGLSVMVSAWRRIGDNAIPARAKPTGGYLNAALAVADAQACGYDEAIMLTAEGYVAEASAANLFVVIGGELVTPTATEDILPGFTREAVFGLAADLGVAVHERQVERTELYTADEMFLCGTGVQIAPITRVDGRAVGDGAVGGITLGIQREYLAAVHGERQAYQHWLTPVFASASGSAHSRWSRLEPIAV
jgi:branched-chain amino acid aminotransferase